MVGLPWRSFSLKYFARFRRDSARAGCVLDASLLALSKTFARICPTEAFAGDEFEVVFKRCVKTLTG